MCAPSVIEEVRKGLTRRDFLRMTAGTVAAVALLSPGGRALAQGGAAVPAGRRLDYTNLADLTHTLSPDFPVFPAFEPMRINNLVTVKANGFYANRWDVGEHTGTHLDAPAHFVDEPGIWAADQVPPSALVAPLAVIHIHQRAASNADAQVTVDDILAYERQFGRIPEGAAVCMHSGWERRVGDAAAYRNQDASGTMHFPGFSPEAADFLVSERNIVGIGVDTLSLDFGPSADFRTHLTVLGANKWGLENLANLATVPPAGAMLIVGAPKVRGASGGPCRVLAAW